MIRSIDCETWMQLRVLVRAKGKPVEGKDLRCTMSRRTKNGLFTLTLIERKLIKIVTKDSNWKKATFMLTPAGIYAAEFGEYDGEPKTGVARKCELHDA